MVKHKNSKRWCKR